VSEFLRHEACSKCGSSDGKAVYLGGSTWCFVCHSYTRGKIFNESIKKQAKDLPEDLSKEYGKEAIEWAGRYSITVEDLLKQGVCYSKRKQALYFIWRDDEEKVIGWQCRNFKEGYPRYISSGSLESVLPIYNYHCGTNLHQCVLVEDCLSAIKVTKAFKEPTITTMPCLTSSLSTSKLNRLAGLFEAFTVWLDGDMFPNAQRMANQLQLLGASAKAVWTPLDPKCYNEQEICNVVLTGKLL